MQRALALIVTAAGCASGTNSVSQDAVAVDAATIDAPVSIDAPMLIDAPITIDAPVMIDAMIDAPIMIDAPVMIDACVPLDVELLTNPALDLAPVGVGWQQTLIDPMYPLITGDGSLLAHSAPYKAWLGGIVSDGFPATVTDVLYQDVVVPANTTQLVLTAQYEVRTAEEPGETLVYDSAAIDVTQTNGTPIVTIRALSNLTPTTVWTLVTHTFTPNLAGQTIRVRMTSTNDFFRPTSFYFDSISLRALHCP